MEGGGRQSVGFKYTDGIQRPGARAQGLGEMVTNTEVSAQDKAEDGKDLDTRDPRDGGRGNKPGPPMYNVHQKAFDALKKEIHKNLKLYTFDVTKPFNLYCDSSDYAVGAVLTQQDNCGLERPISFISQKLTDTQRRWATIEKEAYAIVWALTKLKDVIIGSKIHIFTDHN